MHYFSQANRAIALLVALVASPSLASPLCYRRHSERQPASVRKQAADQQRTIGDAAGNPLKHLDHCRHFHFSAFLLVYFRILAPSAPLASAYIYGTLIM